jgi:hypothetical protein
MKRTLIVFAWMVILPVAGFSQVGRTPTPLITPPGNRAETPGTAIGMVTAVSGQIITVKTEAANPMSFALAKNAVYVNKKGKKIKPDRIKPGARIQVIFEGNEDTRTATRIVLQG